MDDIDTPDSGGRLLNAEKQMTNLSLIDNNNSLGSANIKLGPVITKKTMAQNSATTLNTLKKLPSQPSKTRSMPITPEKNSFRSETSSATQKKVC